LIPVSKRELNRATLDRQHLLRRHSGDVGQEVEHLVGMQAQNPLDPYYALHSRLEGFDPADLATSLEQRDMVRGGFMRGTIHLFSTDDFFRVHPVTADVMRRVFNSTQFAKDCAGLDMGMLLRRGRELLEDKPMTRADIAAALTADYPDRVAGSLAQAVTYLSPLVQVPPRGIWGKSGAAAWAYAPTLLERTYGAGQPMTELVFRYLRAFGPAAVKDMRVWSGFTGLRDVFESMRPDLVTLRDESGTELFDLPDAPRPDPETPAPPRLLPEYDNVLLGHADRSRFFDEGGPKPPGWVGNVLVDGVYGGHWKQGKERIDVHLAATAMARADEVDAEASRMAEMIWPNTNAPVEINPL
jgi:Winged helix DNA-binding domain